MKPGMKHERIHQCSRCEELDEKDLWCIKGQKDIHEPKILRYCIGFTKKKET